MEKHHILQVNGGSIMVGWWIQCIRNATESLKGRAKRSDIRMVIPFIFLVKNQVLETEGTQKLGLDSEKEKKKD